MGGSSKLKRRHLVATLVALALAVASCGGDDARDDPTPAAGTSPAQPSQQPQSEPQAGAQERASSEKPDNGDGGSSAAEAERAAGPDEAAAPRERNSGDRKKKKPRPETPKTPQEQIDSLSASQRRHLHEDLFQQGKTLCYAYGPKELAKAYNMPSTDPATVARKYAEAYEKTTPSLIQPYQQGCLAGFRKFERNPPKN
jgi:hypothetical protein